MKTLAKLAFNTLAVVGTAAVLKEINSRRNAHNTIEGVVLDSNRKAS